MWDNHSDERTPNPIGDLRGGHIKKIRPIDYKKKQAAKVKRRKARKANKIKH